MSVPQREHWNDQPADLEAKRGDSAS